MFQIYWHFIEKGRTPDEIDDMDALGYLRVLAWRTRSRERLEDQFIDDVL